jgi:molybdopterin molybdotransferase
MLSVPEAQERVLAAVAPMPPVETKVLNALGLVLARDLYAPHASPRFDNSAMDGYAVRGEDAREASEEGPVRLRLLGEVRAGDPGDLRVEPGTAARIMTGAPVPDGADAVVPVEETSEDGDEVEVRAETPPGRNVRPAGEDVRDGDLLMRAGVEVGPGEMALIATLGLSPVPVHPRPKVAVVVTGDELVEPEEGPGPGRIRDSNTVALAALLEQAEAEVISMERVGDDRNATVEAFERAAEGADLIVSSGGVAVGRYDFVKEVVEQLGNVDMWRVAMQPGRPVVLGTIRDVPFLGLPGNPVSVHVGFEQFVRPAIRKMRGCATFFRPRIKATLTDPIEKKPGRLHFVRVRLARSGEGWYATPTGPQGSHIQSSLILCHGLAYFASDLERLDPGAEVTVEVWRVPVAVPPIEPEAEVE